MAGPHPPPHWEVPMRTDRETTDFIKRKILRRILFSEGPLPTACWEWTACRVHGYGYISIFSGAHRAHRVAYKMWRGSLRPDLTLDHLCRVRSCVNPWHLEEVTSRENLVRGESPVIKNATKTHCNHGHVLDSRNKDGTRYCSICARLKCLKYESTHREKRKLMRRVRYLREQAGRSEDAQG